MAEPQGAQAITWEEGIHVYGTVTWQAGKHNKAFMKPPKFDHGGWPTPTNQSDPLCPKIPNHSMCIVKKLGIDFKIFGGATK